MAEKYAYIEVRTQKVFGMPGRSPIGFRWIGKKHWKTKISFSCLYDLEVDPRKVEVGNNIRVGPFPLLIIEVLPWELALVAVRRDVTFGLYALIHYFWQKLHCVFYWVWWRIVATAKVWGIVKKDKWE